MGALTAADVERGSTMKRLRVTDAACAPDFIGYLDRLGLRALAGADGSIAIRLWDDVEWLEARLEVERCIDSWVRLHGVPVQLG
jgi:hypothetical protein